MSELYLQLRDFLSQLNDNRVLFLVRFLKCSDSLVQIFDLLRELSNLIFEDLLFSKSVVQFVLQLRSLHAFFIKKCFEFRNTLSKLIDSILKLLNALLVSLQVLNGDFLFLNASAECFDFLITRL